MRGEFEDGGGEGECHILTNLECNTVQLTQLAQQSKKATNNRGKNTGKMPLKNMLRESKNGTIIARRNVPTSPDVLVSVSWVRCIFAEKVK